jgi:hypothetical protein
VASQAATQQPTVRAEKRNHSQPVVSSIAVNLELSPTRSGTVGCMGSSGRNLPGRHRHQNQRTARCIAPTQIPVSTMAIPGPVRQRVVTPRPRATTASHHAAAGGQRCPDPRVDLRRHETCSPLANSARAVGPTDMPRMYGPRPSPGFRSSDGQGQRPTLTPLGNGRTQHPAAAAPSDGRLASAPRVVRPTAPRETLSTV